MSYVFISYSRRDQGQVDRLADHLSKRKIPFWIDRHGISGGEEWRKQIVQGIQNCAAFLLVLSKHSIASRNVRKEIDLAEHYGKRIIPVELESVEIPDLLEYQLIGIQRIDLSGNMASKMGPLSVILQPYRQQVLSEGQSVDVTPEAPTASAGRFRPVEPTQPFWSRIAAVGGLHLIAALIVIGISWAIDADIAVIFLILAIIVPPGLVAGKIIPEVRPHLSGFLIILGSSLGLILLSIGINEITNGRGYGLPEFFLFLGLWTPYLSIPYAGRRSGRPPIWRRVVGVTAIYGLAGLAFAVAWILMLVLINIGRISAGFFDTRVFEAFAPNYLSALAGDGFRPPNLEQIALVYPLTWLVPGIIAGWLLPAVQPYKRVLGIWLGVVVVVGLLGELIFFTNATFFAASNPFSFNLWRGWISLILLVGGTVSTLIYAGRIYLKRRGQ